MQTYSIRLTANHTVCANARCLRFERTDGESIGFKPGEFVSLHIPMADGEIIKRSYSIATLTQDPTQTKDIELVASYVENGRATQWIWQAPIDAQIAYSGPHGMLVLPEEKPGRLILIATGTGVAPYRAMLYQMRPWLEQGLEVHVLFGLRHRNEAFYLSDFRDQAAAFPNFHFSLCLSREAVVAEDEFSGRVTEKLRVIQPECERDLVFLCGNPAMVDEVFAELKEKGFGVKTVRREKYLFSKN